MRYVLSFVLACGLLGTLRLCAEETARDLEAQGVAALKLSQSQPDAIVSAAIFFGKAAETYEKAGDESKVTEMNSFLYWCRKKLTLQQTDALLKAGDAEKALVAKRLLAIGSVAPKVDEAKTYFTRAEAYAQAHPDEHMLVAARFFEVADRFKGNEFSLQAQDRSLKEMMLAGQTPGPAAAKTAPPESAKRLLIPALAQRNEAEKTVLEIYKDELSKTAPADKLELAQKLEAQADTTTDDAAGRFVLLSMSAKLAAEAFDVDVLRATLDKLAVNFDGDLKPFERTALSIVIDRCKDPAVAKVALSFAKLLDKPNDPQANMTVGKHDCFAKGDFERGLPLLVKGAAPALATLAKLDLTNPPEAAGQIAVGDAWWDAAEKAVDKDEKTREGERAAFWYAKAQPALTGLQKIKIEKRLAATGLSKVAVETQPRAAPATAKVAAFETDPEQLDGHCRLRLPLLNSFADVSAAKCAVRVVGTVSKTEQGARFAGDGWLEVPHIPLDNRPFAVALWIRPEGTVYNMGLLEQHDAPGGNDDHYLHIMLRDPDHPRLAFFNNDLQPESSVTPDLGWTHLVFQYVDGAQEIWMNGHLLGSRQCKAYQGSSGVTRIGKVPNLGDTPPWRNFTGTMRDLRIYDVALTAAQIGGLSRAAVASANNSDKVAPPPAAVPVAPPGSVPAVPGARPHPPGAPLSPEERALQTEFRRTYNGRDPAARMAALALLANAYHSSSWQLLANAAIGDSNQAIRVAAFTTLAQEPAHDAALSVVLANCFSAVPATDTELRLTLAQILKGTEFKTAIVNAMVDHIGKLHYPSLTQSGNAQSFSFNPDLLLATRKNFEEFIDVFNALTNENFHAEYELPKKIKPWWETVQRDYIKADAALAEKYRKADAEAAK